MLDDVVGVDDEGGAKGDALIGGDDPERRPAPFVVGDPREVRGGQTLVGLAPGVMDEIAAGEAPLRPRRDREIPCDLAIPNYFGWAAERESLGQ